MKYLLHIIVCLGIGSVGLPANAQEKAGKKDPAVESSGKITKTAGVVKQHSGGQSDPAFVDNDGDGIQDGQERRFRGRYRHRSRAGQSASVGDQGSVASGSSDDTGQLQFNAQDAATGSGQQGSDSETASGARKRVRAGR